MITMQITWDIECDQPMLEMMAFSVGVMRDMLQEEVTAHRKRKRAGERSLPQLRGDVRTADKILAAIYKGQVNLEVLTEVKRKTDVRLEASRPKKMATPGNGKRKGTKK